MNENYFRTKRKTLQKTMEVLGEDPKVCIGQAEIRKLDELHSVGKVFRALGLEPRACRLRSCDQDPPDCQSYNGSGDLIGWEVTELCDEETEKINSKAKTPTERVYRDWTVEDLESMIARKIREKNTAISNRMQTTAEWPYACVNLVIVSDEIAFTPEVAESFRGKFEQVDAENIEQVYLLLSYISEETDCPCISIK